MTVQLKKIIEVIENSGFTKTHLCKKLGLSRQGFYQKLRGESNFSVDELQIISDLTGHQIGFFLQKSQTCNATVEESRPEYGKHTSGHACGNIAPELVNLLQCNPDLQEFILRYQKILMKAQQGDKASGESLARLLESLPSLDKGKIEALIRLSS